MIGWIGTFLVLAAFAIVTRNRQTSTTTHTLNIIGSLMLGFEALAVGSPSIVALNVVWLVVAVYGVTTTKEKEEGARA